MDLAPKLLEDALCLSARYLGEVVKPKAPKPLKPQNLKSFYHCIVLSPIRPILGPYRYACQASTTTRLDDSAQGEGKQHSKNRRPLLNPRGLLGRQWGRTRGPPPCRNTADLLTLEPQVMAEEARVPGAWDGLAFWVQGPHARNHIFMTFLDNQTL